MRQSPEGFLENTIKDGSPDKIAAQAMAAEANSFSLNALSIKADVKSLKFDTEGRYEFLNPEQIKLNQRQQIGAEMQGRDKVSYVSAAFCNPLFLVGMGAAMAVLDEMKAAREARMADLVTGVINADTINSARKATDNDHQLRALRLKEETEEERKKRLLMEATGLLGSGEKAILQATEKSILKSALRSHQLKKDMREKLRKKVLSALDKGWDEKATQRSVVNWLKTSKLVKYKMKLENMMEKSRGKESLSFVSDLAAKLEQVDKALKRAGA